MSTSFRRKSARSSASDSACLAVLVGLASVLAAGCSQSEAAPRPSGAQESAPAANAAEVPKAEGEHYSIEMKATGDYKVGQEAAVEVTIVPKAGYHINAQYPYKFKVAEPAAEGVVYPKPLLKRADGTFTEQSGSFKVPFTASRAGKTKIAGVLSFSVCSEANCLMDRQPLALDVDVK
jgi:hypothetical protein